jgi:hypothetical protein
MSRAVPHPLPTSPLLRNLTFQDGVCFAAQLFMLGRVACAPGAPLPALLWTAALFGVTALTVTLVRGELLPRGRLAATAYRAGIFAPMVLSYFSLRTVLPALRPKLLDGELLALDRALFGETPALRLAPLATAPVVEWYACFYFGYFALLALAFLPPLASRSRNRRGHELFVGASLISALGYVGYTLVPGLGPWAILDGLPPLEGGPWWALVQRSVAAGGAQLDIFPSLHTAFPVFFALQAHAHRRASRWRWTWVLWAFCAANIVVSTMLLRWHYGVDVIVGLLLALLARRVARAVAEREAARLGPGVQPVWP